ncbi:MAG: 5-oxoprolinase subunit PxpB [Rhodoferax sp.]|nr:5-oxoprolinase subunit PxpB [Rhodoferax sp.]
METLDKQVPRLLALGDAAWTLEFGNDISAALNARVTGVADRINQVRQQLPLLASVTDVVPTYRSLTVHFDPRDAHADDLGTWLLALGKEGHTDERKGRQWRLPVCFDKDFAPDLPTLAAAKGLSEDQVIERLLAAEFRVYMIGFLPGFPYMGGLPAELSMPRLASPRQRVPKNSIAVAGAMCSVYPWESPGGWNLLGRTPVPLFDLQHAEQPAMLAAGDRVRWYAVPRDAYDHLLALSQTEALARDTFLHSETKA